MSKTRGWKVAEDIAVAILDFLYGQDWNAKMQKGATVSVYLCFISLEDTCNRLTYELSQSSVPHALGKELDTE